VNCSPLNVNAKIPELCTNSVFAVLKFLDKICNFSFFYSTENATVYLQIMCLCSVTVGAPEIPARKLATASIACRVTEIFGQGWGRGRAKLLVAVSRTVCTHTGGPENSGDAEAPPFVRGRG